MIICNAFWNILLIKIDVLYRKKKKQQLGTFKSLISYRFYWYLYGFLKMIYTIIITQHSTNIKYFWIFFRGTGNRRSCITSCAANQAHKSEEYNETHSSASSRVMSCERTGWMHIPLQGLTRTPPVSMEITDDIDFG